MQTDSKHDRCHVNCQQTGSLSCKLAANRVVPCQKKLGKKLETTLDAYHPPTDYPYLILRLSYPSLILSYHDLRLPYLILHLILSYHFLTLI